MPSFIFIGVSIRSITLLIDAIERWKSSKTWPRVVKGHNNLWVIKTKKLYVPTLRTLFQVWKPPISKIAIKANKIGGAAIDVFETEPATNNALFGLENVLLTPHIAASTSEAQIIVAEMVANQFVEYFLNNKVINEVTW